MNVLVTGNMGYVGPVVMRHLRETMPDAALTGLDLGYFARYLTTLDGLPERLLDCQHFADVRDAPQRVLADVDAVVHLAAARRTPCPQTTPSWTMAAASAGTPAGTAWIKLAGAVTTDMYGTFPTRSPGLTLVTLAPAASTPPRPSSQAGGGHPTLVFGSLSY
jgi:hypothetical protein